MKMWIFFFENSLFLMYLIDNQSLSCFGIGFVFSCHKNNHLNILGYEKVFCCVSMGNGIRTCSVVCKRYSTWSEECDCDKSFYPVEVNNAPTGWHQDLCCYLN